MEIRPLLIVRREGKEYARRRNECLSNGSCKTTEGGNHVQEIQERSEVMLHVANDLGVLAKLFAVLAVQSPSVDAWRFYSDHRYAAVLLVTEKDSEIVEALRLAGFECETNRVVVVEEKHRCLSAVRLGSELRANGIEMLDAYACCSPDDGNVLVLKATDSSRAVNVLEAMNLWGARPVDSQQELVAAGEVDQQPTTGRID